MRTKMAEMMSQHRQQLKTMILNFIEDEEGRGVSAEKLKRVNVDRLAERFEQATIDGFINDLVTYGPGGTTFEWLFDMEMYSVERQLENEQHEAQMDEFYLQQQLRAEENGGLD